MANPEQLAILQLGVAEWNIWRRNHRLSVANLSATEIREYHIPGFLVLETGSGCLPEGV